VARSRRPRHTFPGNGTANTAFDSIWNIEERIDGECILRDSDLAHRLAPAILVVAVDLAVAVAVFAIVAILLADHGPFAGSVPMYVVDAVRAPGVCAVVNPGTEGATGFSANDRAGAIAVPHLGIFALKLWSLAVSPAVARFRLPLDASGAGERAIIRRLVQSLVVPGHAVLGHIALAVVRPFTATLWQLLELVVVLVVVGEEKCHASFDLPAIVGSKGAIDPAFVASGKN